VAQRLVRTICPECRQSYVPEEEELLELGPEAEGLRGSTFHFGKGCERCYHTGYRGRMGHLRDPGARRGPAPRDPLARLDAGAAPHRAGGRHAALRASGIAAIAAGRTTLDEVLRGDQPLAPRGAQHDSTTPAWAQENPTQQPLARTRPAGAQAPAGGPAAAPRRRRGRVSSQATTDYTLQLATRPRAGIPIAKALAILEARARPAR
jgi:hypothetical protein